jgi:hypothetical protein
MTERISKIQHKDFEVGEFIEETKRSYGETITLIGNFPWIKEREKIEIALTNPSVTIEGTDNDFLKIAVFYNNKFVLHYFDRNQVLFSKSFTNLTDSYKYIKDYFESTTFVTVDFRKENTWLQNNLKHFVSQDFRYEVTPKSIRKFLILTSGVSFVLSIFFILILLVNGINHMNMIGTVAILLSAFFIGGGLNLILFFNYYFYTKDKILIMSKGNHIFYFGNRNNPTEYNKKEIFQFTTIRSRNYRSPINAFALIEIEFKNGTIIKIPNILVDYFALERKLFECQKIDKGGFPFIRN